MAVSTFLQGACVRVDGTAAPLTSPTLEHTSVTTDARTEFILKSEEGDSIAITQWHSEGVPRAAILAVHGYGDYGPSTFAKAAHEWAKKGITTIAYDQRGFGRNPSNGNWPGHQALTADLGIIAMIIREQHPALPMTLVAHSMGGAVATAAIGEGAIHPEQLVLLAPALWGGTYLNPALRASAHLAHTFFPNKRWSGDGIVRIQASDNIEMLKSLGRDPLYVGNPSSREFVGLINLMDRAVAAAPSVAMRSLVIYGAKDQVLDEGPITASFDRFSGSKKYVRVDTGWHMLLRDLGAKTVRDMVANFVLESAEI